MAVLRSLMSVTVLFLVAGCAMEPEPAAEETPPRELVFTGGPELIQPFLGVWEGETTPSSEVQRTLAVLIEGSEGENFSVTWRNWEVVQGSETEDGQVQIREARLDFAPTGEANQYAWVGNGTEEALGAEATASLEDGRLVVAATAPLEDGRQERQTYVRTVDGESMALQYSRWVDDELRRSLQATLTRTDGG